jgi:WD40 repeat protein
MRRTVIAIIITVSVRVVAQSVSLIPQGSLEAIHDESISAIAFSPDGSLLVAIANNGETSLIDWETRRVIANDELCKKPLHVFFAAGDQDIVAVFDNGVWTCDAQDLGNPERVMSAKDIRCAAHDAGRRIVLLGCKKELIAYDVIAEMQIASVALRDHLGPPMGVSFNRHGTELRAIDAWGRVAIWDLGTARLIKSARVEGGTIATSQSQLYAAATNRAANVLAVGLQEIALAGEGLMRRNLLIALDWASLVEIKSTVFPYGRVDGMAMGPGNDHVCLIGAKKRMLVVADMRRGEIVVEAPVPNEPTSIEISADGNRLAVGTEKGSVVFWEIEGYDRLETGTGRHDIPSLGGRIRADSETPIIDRSEQLVLAVLSFELSGVADEIGEAALNQMSVSLSNVPHLTLVERARINDVAEQLALSLTGLTVGAGVEIGKMLDADVVLLCSISSLGRSMIFTARIVEVETGVVLGGRQVLCEECLDSDVFDAVNLLASLVAQ